MAATNTIQAGLHHANGTFLAYRKPWHEAIDPSKHKLTVIAPKSRKLSSSFFHGLEENKRR